MKAKRLATSLSITVLLTAACAPPDREVQLRDTILAMAGALETHQAGPFLDHVAEDFTGDSGAWDAQRVKRFVLGHTLRKERVSIGLDEIAITLHDDRATVDVDTSIAGDTRWWSGRGADYRFHTGWRLEDGEWMVIRADWERVRDR